MNDADEYRDDDTNGQDNGHSASFFLEDPELAEQFERLVDAARVKGFATEDTGYSLFHAAIDLLLASGVQECCVMQMLVDCLTSYYGDWHDRMGDATGEDLLSADN